MERRDFWREVLAIHGSVTPYIRQRVFVFGLWAALVWIVAAWTGIEATLGVAHYEIVGVVLALLLVLRTNSGYDRWWEGRKLWGGIVNQSRNLAMIGVAYGPRDPEWRDALLRWTAAFPHLARHSLRGERDLSDMAGLLNSEELRQVQTADHIALDGSMQVARLLETALANGEINEFAFMQAEQQRSELIDHLGACERILNTPLAKVVSIKIRRFLFLFLIVLPMAIAERCGALTPFLQVLVAYPLLSLDQIGIELENPFSVRRLSHLPLQDIGDTIQRNILALGEKPELARQNGRRELVANC
jgi:putative membrane protein